MSDHTHPVIAGADSQVVSLPRGILSHVRLTADTTQNIATSVLTTVTGTRSVDYGTAAAGNFSLSSVTLVAGRSYRLTYSGQVKSTVANDQAAAILTQTAGTAVVTGNSPFSRVPMVTANAPTSQAITWTFKCTTGGTATFTVQVNRPSGSGNVNVQADANLVLEDIGVL